MVFRGLTFICAILLAATGVAAGHKNRVCCCYVYLCRPVAVPGTAKVGDGITPVTESIRVFLVGEDSKPGTDFYLIGPDGQRLNPDDEGLVVVPQSWKDKEVSVRQVTDGKEVRTVKLAVQDGKLPRVEAIEPGTTDDSGVGQEADRPGSRVSAAAIERRQLLRQASLILQDLHRKNKFPWHFEPTNLPGSATQPSQGSGDDNSTKKTDSETNNDGEGQTI